MHGISAKTKDVAITLEQTQAILNCLRESHMVAPLHHIQLSYLDNAIGLVDALENFIFKTETDSNIENVRSEDEFCTAIAASSC